MEESPNTVFDPVARRTGLRILASGTGSAFLPRGVAQEAQEATAKAKSVNTPLFFNGDQYRLIQNLCDSIFPAGEGTGGALEAGVPQFIDLLTSESPGIQLKLAGGLMWLDSYCRRKYGTAYLECGEGQRKQVLDLISRRESVEAQPELRHGVAFFSVLRKLTADGFFTSQIGIEYLGYLGNAVLTEFSGCPDAPPIGPQTATPRQDGDKCMKLEEG